MLVTTQRTTTWTGALRQFKVFLSCTGHFFKALLRGFPFDRRLPAGLPQRPSLTGGRRTQLSHLCAVKHLEFSTTPKSVCTEFHCKGARLTHQLLTKPWSRQLGPSVRNQTRSLSAVHVPQTGPYWSECSESLPSSAHAHLLLNLTLFCFNTPNTAGLDQELTLTAKKP